MPEWPKILPPLCLLISNGTDKAAEYETFNFLLECEFETSRLFEGLQTKHPVAG